MGTYWLARCSTGKHTRHICSLTGLPSHAQLSQHQLDELLSRMQPSTEGSPSLQDATGSFLICRPHDEITHLDRARNPWLLCTLYVDTQRETKHSHETWRPSAGSP